MLRRTLLAAAVLAIAATARADIPELLACADQSDPKARLACYDSEAAKLKTQMAEAEKRKSSLFGFALPFGDSGSGEEQHPEPKLAPQEIREIDAKLIAVASDIGRHQILTLNNGQVWRIDDSRTLFLTPGKDLVAIVRNDLGGYYLSLNGRDNKLSVSRVR